MNKLIVIVASGLIIILVLLVLEFDVLMPSSKYILEGNYKDYGIQGTIYDHRKDKIMIRLYHENHNKWLLVNYKDKRVYLLSSHQEIICGVVFWRAFDEEFYKGNDLYDDLFFEGETGTYEFSDNSLKIKFHYYGPDENPHNVLQLNILKK